MHAGKLIVEGGGTEQQEGLCGERLSCAGCGMEHSRSQHNTTPFGAIMYIDNTCNLVTGRMAKLTLPQSIERIMCETTKGLYLYMAKHDFLSFQDTIDITIICTPTATFKGWHNYSIILL